MTKNFNQINQFLKAKDLPKYKVLFELCNAACDVLEKEITPYRSADSLNKPGGLVQLYDDKPCIIIPDIHARPFFVKNILNFQLPCSFTGQDKIVTVAAALEKKIINLVAVGDAVHSELDPFHWNKIEGEFERQEFTGPEMTKEMENCLGVLAALMKLKTLFPENFHFIKGNHENILNENEGGDFSFRKFADEGNMVKTFIQNYYGEDILYLISCFEKALPLVVCGNNYVISHAEPAECFTKEDLINARQKDDVVQGLIWTRNDTVQQETAKFIIEQLVSEENKATAFYFGGHRPVTEDYFLRQNGRFIQIHNPVRQNIVLVYNNKVFNPDTDITGVYYD